MNNPSRLTSLLLIYGFFAVLCQLCLMLLCLRMEDPSRSFALLRHVYLPWLESPLVSVLLIIGGATLFTYLFGKER